MASRESLRASTEQAAYHDPSKYNRSLYPQYENLRLVGKIGNIATQQAYVLGSATLDLLETIGMPSAFGKVQRAHGRAMSELMEWGTRDFNKPEFGINDVEIDGQRVAVRESVVEGLETPHGRLLHFERDTDRNDPKTIILAAKSGHYSTLMRETVREQLKHHDTHITDWDNARDIPMSAGEFGLDDNIDQYVNYIRALGPDVNIVAICQATVPAMAAVSYLAQTDPAAQPNSLTLMGGPLDSLAAPTVVTKFAQENSIEWFRDNVTGKVPGRFKGADRLVYPGMQQLASFMGMNVENHQRKQRELYRALVDGDETSAKRIMDFYTEYFSVCDMDRRFYLDTVKRVFIDNQMANGTFEYRGVRIDPGAIDRTAVFTVEGANDDIAAPGQTVAVHNWLTGLDESKQFHHLQEGIGHYGLFSGSKWSNEINPRITAFIREAATRNGRNYDVAA